MPNLSELTSYKRTIVNALLRDKEFVELVTDTENPVLPASELYGRNIFLYDYADSTVTDDKVIVCVEVDDREVVNRAVAHFNLYIYIGVPKSMMDMGGKIRRDAIAQRVDEILNGSTAFGFGRLKKEVGQRIRYNDNFRARVLVYTNEDWNGHNTTL